MRYGFGFVLAALIAMAGIAESQTCVNGVCSTVNRPVVNVQVPAPAATQPAVAKTKTVARPGVLRKLFGR